MAHEGDADVSRLTPPVGGADPAVAPAASTDCTDGGSTAPGASATHVTSDAAGSIDAQGSFDANASFGLVLGPCVAVQPPDLVGKIVGSVRITGVIADGGMGRVYEGVQDSPRRRVAVKVLRPDAVSPERLRRFAFEAEILGRLKHPGIAQIYTAGTHAIGGVERPYFVMERVDDARPITAFVRERGLGPRESLMLFLQVCEAVGHGHSRGVIHRDIKPANLLVDGSGSPKVIDYGVARATEEDVAEASQVTGLGDLVGTVAYMSPEQFAARPDDIDVRTDVYSLGVVLHEMLSGRHPFDLRGLPVYEAARVVRESSPPALVDRCPAAGRDVSCIVAKCLEKEPGRRYGSAGELAEDIRRQLEGEPILAVPPTLLDTARRFVSRHRAVTAAAAVAACAIVAALVGISMLAIEASRQAEEARRGRARADAVLAFLVDALRSPDPTRDGRKVTVAETLTRAADVLRGDGHAGITDPETRSRILSAVGATLRQLGMPRESARALEEAVQATGPEATPGMVASFAGSLQASGELERSAAVYADVLASARSQDDPLFLAQTLRGIASVENQLGRYDESRAHITEAIEVLDHRGVGSARDMASSLGQLGAIAQQQSRYGEALSLNERAFSILEQEFGLRDAETLVMLGRTAASLEKQGESARARQLFERGIPVAEDLLGEEHPITANLLESYGMTLISLGLEREAEEPLRRAVGAFERSLGPDHIFLATVGEKIAWSLLRRGRYAEAEVILRNGLRIKEAALGPRNIATAQVLALLGWAVAAQGKPEEARPILERCLSIRREVLGDDNVETARSLYAMADNCNARGDAAAAAQHAEESIAIMERIHGAGCQQSIPALHALGRARQSLGDHEAAVAMASKALAIRERVSPEENLDTALAVKTLADQLRAAGRVADALPYYTRALRIREKLLEPDSQLIAEVRRAIAGIAGAGGPLAPDGAAPGGDATR
jgi:non-specific serine/threonine protein kinase/serine/threonine-protein kinase